LGLFDPHFPIKLGIPQQVIHKKAWHPFALQLISFDRNGIIHVLIF